MNIAIIVPHFNWFNFHRPVENLHRFRKSLGHSFEVHHAICIADGPADPYAFLYPARFKNVMWQKERLINLALQSWIPPDCDAVAWIDGDLLFDNPDWYDTACQMLSDFPVLQLFETITYLGPEDQPLMRGVGSASAGDKAAFRAPGGAIACRRELLANGIYDRDVLGCGDDIFMAACLGTHERFCRRLHQPYQQSVRRWCKSFGAHPVGVVPGNVRHLYHGRPRDRAYGTRSAILADHGYDPERDVQIGDSGLLEWASDKPALHAAVCHHFKNRQEDWVPPPHKSGEHGHGRSRCHTQEI